MNFVSSTSPQADAFRKTRRLLGFFLAGAALQVFSTAALAQSVAPKVTESVIWNKGELGLCTHRVFGLCGSRNGTLLSFTEGRFETIQDDGPHHLLLKRSTDQGTTWGEPIFVDRSEHGESYANPTPVADRNTGRVFLFYALNSRNATTQVFYRTSDDEGQTWSARTEVTHLFDNDPLKRPFHLPGPGHGIQLQSGRLAVQVWHRHPLVNGSRTNLEYTVSLLVSDNAGKTWRAGGYLTTGYGANESRLVQLANGDVLLNARGTDKIGRVIARSRDGGLTWSEPVKDTQAPPFRKCDAGLVRLTEGQAAGKDWLVFSHPATTEGRLNTTVSLSRDGGATWPVRRVIDPFSGYSDVVELNGGAMGVLYHASKEDYRKTTEWVGPEVKFARLNLEWLTETPASSQRQ